MTPLHWRRLWDAATILAWLGLCVALVRRW